MEKLYTTTINWQVVNTRKKDKNLPRLHSTVIYVLEKEGFKPTFGVATIYSNGECTIMCNGMLKLPIKNGLKWCYVDELEIIEKSEE